MALQIWGEHSSQNGTKIKIEIYNSGFGGVSTEVTMQSSQITYDRESDPIMETLKTSELQFSMINSVAAFDTFITNIVNGSEDQFTVKMSQDTGGGYTFAWAGVLLGDQITEEDTPKPRVYQFRAIDGLGRLKTIPFAKVTEFAYASQQTLMDFIIDALSYNGLDGFWSVSDTYIAESIEFYDTQMTTVSGGYSPLVLTRFYKQNFSDGEEDINGAIVDVKIPKPMMCFDVIKSILDLFSARIMISDGSYRIQQVRNFATSTYTTRNILKDGTVDAYNTTDNRLTDDTDILRRANGTYSYMPPLKSVKVVMKDAGVGNGLLNDVEVITESSAVYASTITLGTVVRSRADDAISFTLPFESIYEMDFLQYDWKLDITVKVICGSYRLAWIGATKDIQWTTTPSDYLSWNYRSFDFMYGFEDDGVNRLIGFITPPLPFASESSCTIEISVQLSPFSGAVLNTDLQLQVNSIVLAARASGSFTGEEVYIVENPSTTNSAVIDYGELKITDYENVVLGRNQFEVYTGSDWVVSNVWDADYSTDVTLAKTLALETMSLQNKPVKVYRGTLWIPASLSIQKNFRPYMAYYYDSKVWVFNGGRVDLNENSITGEWFVLTVARSGLSVIDYGDAKPTKKILRNLSSGIKKTPLTKEWNDRDMMGQLAADVTTTTTSLTTTPILNGLMKDGDKLHIYHPDTFTDMGFFVLNGDVAKDDTTITVDSKDLGVDVYAGYKLGLNHFEVDPSEDTRGSTLRTTGTFTMPPTTSAPDILTANGMIVIDGVGKLWYRSNDKIYSVAGLESI
jgi:hypothetical protein